MDSSKSFAKDIRNGSWTLLVKNTITWGQGGTIPADAGMACSQVSVHSKLFATFSFPPTLDQTLQCSEECGQWAAGIVLASLHAEFELTENQTMIRRIFIWNPILQSLFVSFLPRRISRLRTVQTKYPGLALTDRRHPHNNPDIYGES